MQVHYREIITNFSFGENAKSKYNSFSIHATTDLENMKDKRKCVRDFAICLKPLQDSSALSRKVYAKHYFDSK